ncbi:zinc metallopeptidase, partial [Candidatus Poribacteria bacterium]
MFFFDPLYLLFAAPGLLLAFWAQSRVKVVFAEYSEVGLTRRQTGAQIARNILQRSGLNHVNVERTDSFLGDHYDP